MLPWWLCGSALPFGIDRPWIDRPRKGSYQLPSTEDIGPDVLPTFVYFIKLPWAWEACQSLFLFWISKTFSFSHKESPRSLQIEEGWYKIITCHLVNASQCVCACLISCNMENVTLSKNTHIERIIQTVFNVLKCFGLFLRPLYVHIPHF